MNSESDGLQSALSTTRVEDVPATISPEDIRIWVKTVQENLRAQSFAAFPHVTRLANQVLQRVSTSGVITVHLEIPKWVQNGLRQGRYTFDKYRGVVREVGTGKTVTWLSESNIGSKLAKVKNVALFFVLVVDAAERILVDKKLQGILKSVKGIDQKIDAQNKSKLLTGFQILRECRIIPDHPGNS